MMKKVSLAALALVWTISLAACGEREEALPAPEPVAPTEVTASPDEEEIAALRARVAELEAAAEDEPEEEETPEGLDVPDDEDELDPVEPVPSGGARAQKAPARRGSSETTARTDEERLPGEELIERVLREGTRQDGQPIRLPDPTRLLEE